MCTLLYTQRAGDLHGIQRKPRHGDGVCVVHGIQQVGHGQVRCRVGRRLGVRSKCIERQQGQSATPAQSRCRLEGREGARFFPGRDLLSHWTRSWKLQWKYEYVLRRPRIARKCLIDVNVCVICNDITQPGELCRSWLKQAGLSGHYRFLKRRVYFLAW
jgi:hypothetical protein